MSETVKEWWDARHASGKIKYLTGSSGKAVWSFLNIQPWLNSDKTVLEIGVGLGRCTQDTFETGVRLSALDISEVGLQRVEPWTVAQYTTSESLPDDMFDLAFSHLVAQHMSDVDLVAQMREVLRALKPDGILAMQFADSPQRDQGALAQKKGGVCRNFSEMGKLVGSVKGKVVWRSKERKFPNGAKWYALHIRRVA
jgi:SAM-dependent methyltransferase